MLAPRFYDNMAIYGNNNFIIDGAGFWLSFFLLFSKNIFLGMGIGKKGMRKKGHKKEEEEVRDG